VDSACASDFGEKKAIFPDGAFCRCQNKLLPDYIHWRYKVQ
jgi:hypothetical protein